MNLLSKNFFSESRFFVLDGRLSFEFSLRCDARLAPHVRLIVGIRQMKMNASSVAVIFAENSLLSRNALILRSCFVTIFPLWLFDMRCCFFFRCRKGGGQKNRKHLFAFIKQKMAYRTG